MLYPVADKIEEIARPVVELKGAFIIDVKVRGERGGKVVEVFVDTDSGVTADLCADISRELSRTLDIENIFQGRYHLVVSSPGIDRPLKYSRQYPQHVGRTLSVKHKTNGQIQKIEGVLVQATSDSIELRLQDETVTKFAFEDIIEAYVKTAW